MTAVSITNSLTCVTAEVAMRVIVDVVGIAAAKKDKRINQ